VDSRRGCRERNEVTTLPHEIFRADIHIFAIARIRSSVARRRKRALAHRTASAKITALECQGPFFISGTRIGNAVTAYGYREEVVSVTKRKRINLSPDDDTAAKIERLAHACRTHPTTFAYYLVKLCVNNVNIVEFVQRQHNVEERFKVRCKIEGNTLIYD
jgi:hypothetical protein